MSNLCHFLEKGEFCTRRKMSLESFVCGGFCPWGDYVQESYVPGEFHDRRELYLESFVFFDFGRIKSRVNFLLESIVPGDICPWRVLFRENFLLESNVRRVMSGREKSGRVL